MTAIARRLDPCANWFRLIASTRGRILWIFPALLLAGYLIALRAGHPMAGFASHSRERAAHADLARQARESGLDYERVAAHPEAFIGRPVVWCVATPAAESSYVSGRPSWPVELLGSVDDYRTGSGTGGYCFDILAVVAGRQRGRLQIRPIERL